MKKTNATTVKLTAAQQKVLDNAKREIDYARSCKDVLDYAIRNYGPILNGTATEEIKAELRAKEKGMLKPQQIEALTHNWENRKRGIVWTIRVNSKSLLKLEELGLIEIIELTNGAYGMDTIRILNY